MYKTYFCGCGHFFDAWVLKDSLVACPACNVGRHPRNYALDDRRPGRASASAPVNTLDKGRPGSLRRAALAISPGVGAGRGLSLSSHRTDFDDAEPPDRPRAGSGAVPAGRRPEA